jgi:heme/copper-type cytochrome/quinol oxidase subunit 3
MALTSAAAHARAEATHRPRANKIGLWLFIASETFLFAALISTRYVVWVDRPHELDELNWGAFPPEGQILALAITIVLLASSISAFLAEASIAHDDRKRFLFYIRMTIGLGLLFMIGVGLEWNEGLRGQWLGNAETDIATYGSQFYTLIGLHAFHVFTGILALGVVWLLGRKGHFGSQDYWGAEGVVKYWHFVDLAWVVIYPTLYLF